MDLAVSTLFEIDRPASAALGTAFRRGLTPAAEEMLMHSLECGLWG